MESEKKLTVMCVLDIIEENYKQEKSLINIKGMFPINVLPMNESQKEALREVEKNTLTTVIGAAGTGKSSLITNIASHFIMSNRKVLIVGKSDHAVDVVANKLNSLGAGEVALRGGKWGSQIDLANKLMDVVENKINLNISEEEKTNIVKYFLSEKKETEAKKLLKKNRVEAIKMLKEDPNYRKNLIIQAKSCLTKRKNKREEIMQKVDYKPILEAFPCVCVTTYEISDVLPLIKDMFDLVIADESSEMDIASVIPCLYRAKKAVIVGDNKQLKSLNFLDNNKNKSFMIQNNIPIELQMVWDYRENSLFDFAQYYSEKCILLNRQYRMSKSAFEFSNQEFYGGLIESEKEENSEAIKKVFVENAKTEESRTCNMKECTEIIKTLKEWLKENKNNNKTVAVLSMFKEQVNLIDLAIREVISYEDIEKHNIKVLTANTAQGMEFDLCLISWCIADDSKHQSLTFINNAERLNVIITRSREQVINFYSIKKMAHDCLLNRYLNSIKNY